MHVYPVAPRAASSIPDEGEVPGGGSLMVAVRASDLVSPLRSGAPLAAGDRSALVIGGTGKIRTGEAVVFLKVVAVAPAQVRRDGRNALGPGPLAELQDIVLRASHAGHEDRDWRAVAAGRDRPLTAGSLDGTLIRVPDTPANREAYGSVGTGDDSSPFPQVRALPQNDAIRPVEPAVTGTARRLPACPENSSYPVSPKQEPDTEP